MMRNAPEQSETYIQICLKEMFKTKHKKEKKEKRRTKQKKKKKTKKKKTTDLKCSNKWGFKKVGVPDACFVPS